MCTTTGGVCMSAEHERLKKDEAWWAAQRFIGYQRVDDTAYLELRNCRAEGCDSTLARWCDGPFPVPVARAAEDVMVRMIAHGAVL